MIVNHKRKLLARIPSHSRKLVGALVLCGLTIGLQCGSAWALFAGSLKGIVLDSSPAETKIILRSDHTIPYRLVSHNDEKIVVDLETMDYNQSIPTDFAAADNIEQVVLKPIGRNKLRLIVRGYRVGSPFVTGSPATSRAQSQHKLAGAGESVLRQVTQPAVNGSADRKIVFEGESGGATTAPPGRRW